MLIKVSRVSNIPAFIDISSDGTNFRIKIAVEEFLEETIFIDGSGPGGVVADSGIDEQINRRQPNFELAVPETDHVDTNLEPIIPYASAQLFPERQSLQITKLGISLYQSSTHVRAP
ncbi:hypothetical protein V6N12_028508 [Hibiscus sabdariffa]|uniref:Uncharacterized protein n=1 Tax=Hibiscus sabdariffa TaxID=183260 RepID=A0ABR2F618_9ROSI